MFGSIGGFELMLLAAIGLLVFGPRRLPEIGRSLGRAMGEFRKAAVDLRTSIEREVHLEELKETTRTIQSAARGDLLTAAEPAAGETVSPPAAGAVLPPPPPAGRPAPPPSPDPKSVDVVPED